MYDQYDALIFDMDGTLVDSGQLHEFGWTTMLNKYAIPIDRQLMRSLAGVPTKGTIEILLEKFNLKRAASLDEMNAFKEQVVHENMHKYVKPTALLGVAQKYHGIKPMAVGTGAYTQEAAAILELCGLYKYVSVVVGADQVINPKPAPDTFLRCAELLGVDPKQCVVFEDSKLGLQAAASAGMVGIDVLLVHAITNEYFV
ncbi:MAG TPA: beta-phosphoglucomutase family hydrolase [Cellvibrionaceae bacterium]|nr:beta-phosphoglucomutase family hydrolase [Cellvibrionaceae bacterium]HMW71934.1 beta-phosphoglucomutase family hydrolase [Cellvibrionaceae bacterium]HMY40056.1 beta-phosphoglucomutase family hydrolase [Marinagarivorans sp.]HNG59116.1 beta-phosphoglucomutase family hydrolase [Cellvibrionaceae bacterium]